MLPFRPERCTQLSFVVSYRTICMLYPTELFCTLLGYAAPY